jgi:hypothetical protein
MPVRAGLFDLVAKTLTAPSVKDDVVVIASYEGLAELEKAQPTCTQSRLSSEDTLIFRSRTDYADGAQAAEYH